MTVVITADGNVGICLDACKHCTSCQMAPFPRTLTVGARFVNKVAEIEQGGPGGQVLNEPLRSRTKQNSGNQFVRLRS